MTCARFVHVLRMPAANGNKALNLSIDKRVCAAALRVFAGKPRGRQLSDFVERQLIRKCREAGEKLPADLLTK